MLEYDKPLKGERMKKSQFLFLILMCLALFACAPAQPADAIPTATPETVVVNDVEVEKGSCYKLAQSLPFFGKTFEVGRLTEDRILKPITLSEEPNYIFMLVNLQGESETIYLPTKQLNYVLTGDTDKSYAELALRLDGLNELVAGNNWDANCPFTGNEKTINEYLGALRGRGLLIKVVLHLTADDFVNVQSNLWSDFGKNLLQWLPGSK